MKQLTIRTLAVAGALCLAIPAFATDYTGYSLQQLSQMRGTMMHKSQADREAFRNAWREKMKAATPGERTAFAHGGGNGRGYGYGMYHSNGNGCLGSGNCDGSGKGHGHGHGRR